MGLNDMTLAVVSPDYQRNLFHVTLASRAVHDPQKKFVGSPILGLVDHSDLVPLGKASSLASVGQSKS